MSGAEQSAERELKNWRQQNARRDALIHAAYEGGLSKNRIHVLTGIARSTIDRILKNDSTDGNHD